MSFKNVKEFHYKKLCFYKNKRECLSFYIVNSGKEGKVMHQRQVEKKPSLDCFWIMLQL